MPSTIARNTLYQDATFSATELNRKSGQILDAASEGPVTIHRNGESYALMSRKRASALYGKTDSLAQAFEITNAAHRIRFGEQISSSHRFAWLKAFDSDELVELIDEVSEAYQRAMVTDDGWNFLLGIIHEWCESAIAIVSDELDEAWNTEDDEASLDDSDDDNSLDENT
ncbi:hypothetical protein N836_13545 [Leptolyngbya sp. Heron Island J]|uniref:hypothetical protein n=1 Tax=Leptolyngbya sp. Heron Island J TaxID=1385935 RepID=UPI0003B9EC8E|nr:hypothetical protein [Leptolyngbya sp. Heron Island J]ESA35084.1 hypothetical protein N836_13545 [Leptolyngbya sp. Heron Island J]